MRRAVLTVAIFGLVCGVAAAAPPPGIADGPARKGIESGRCAGLAVALYKDGQLTERFYGDAGNGAPPDRDTVFQIGSITKVFTTALLALEVQRGRMRLADPAQLYAPPALTLPRFKGAEITLVQLAAHMSGLPRKIPGDETLTLPAMARYLSGYRLQAKPGTTYLYSNLAIGLLGQLIAAGEKTSVGALYARDITGPLNMRDTGFDLSRAQQARLAIGYGEKGRAAPLTFPSWPVLESAGALYSTLADMEAFLAWQIDGAPGDLGAILPLLHKPYFKANASMRIGLSWEFRDLGGFTSIEKGGATHGYTSYVAFVPETRTGVVVLSNKRSCRVGPLATTMLSSLNGVKGGGARDDDSGAD